MNRSDHEQQERQRELEARELAESVREKTWRGDSFLRDLFLGRFRLDLLHPWAYRPSLRPEFRAFYDALERFLIDEVDPVEIDRTGEYPSHVILGLAKLGAFGMKIEREYGGLGLTHAEYVEVMQLVGSHDANVAALLSAHQAIGVPQPIRLFGTEEQKRAFLPRCAAGEISAFALTEPAVGSDPGTLTTTAELSEDGSHYILTGEKLWCTNGTLADLLVVMARNPATGRINAFVVETKWEGVHVEGRCHFMGLKALANAYLRFDGVRIPADHRIGDEGEGLKIALVTLNTGRLTLPAATTGGVKRCVEIMRKWAHTRVQWGVPIGKHEAVAHPIADATADAFAMEAVGQVVGQLADRPDYDLRLEAAAAKEWNTKRAWKIIDETLQVRGGRGFETETSLRDRGEPAIGVERMLRDARINLIFEGSSEIMHLFMAREAVDKHLRVAGTLVDPKASSSDKLSALPSIGAFYALWYPSQWLPRGAFFRFREFGPLAKHIRFVERRARKLARSVFHGMLVHQAKLEKKQAFLFRLVDIAIELFAITATVSRAQALRLSDDSRARSAVELADLFCRNARRRVDASFHALWRNDDARKFALARNVLESRYGWLEQGTIPLGISEDEMKPKQLMPGSAETEPVQPAEEWAEGEKERRAG